MRHWFVPPAPFAFIILAFVAAVESQHARHLLGPRKPTAQRPSPKVSCAPAPLCGCRADMGFETRVDKDEHGCVTKCRCQRVAPTKAPINEVKHESEERTVIPMKERCPPVPMCGCRSDLGLRTQLETDANGCTTRCHCVSSSRPHSQLLRKDPKLAQPQQRALENPPVLAGTDESEWLEDWTEEADSKNEKDDKASDDKKSDNEPDKKGPTAANKDDKSSGWGSKAKGFMRMKKGSAAAGKDAKSSG